MQVLCWNRIHWEKDKSMMKLSVEIDEYFLKQLVVDAIRSKVMFPVTTDSVTFEVKSIAHDEWEVGNFRVTVNCLFDYSNKPL